METRDWLSMSRWLIGAEGKKVPAKILLLLCLKQWPYFSFFFFCPLYTKQQKLTFFIQCFFFFSRSPSFNVAIKKCEYHQMKWRFCFSIYVRVELTQRGSIRGRPKMTSRDFGQFLTPPLSTVMLFITKALVLLSQNHWPPPSPLKPWRHLWVTPKSEVRGLNS